MRARRFRIVAIAAVAGLVAALAPLSAERAVAGPPDVVADTPAEYALCGRVFPDPMAYAPSSSAAPGESPYAKGNAVCRAGDFLSHDAALRGLHFLEDLFPRFVEVIDLTDPRFDKILDRELGDGQSAGIPDETLVRDRANLTMVKVTDAESRVKEKQRRHYVFPLSIHGIERAGIEGGLRAVEDLATWGTHEPDREIMETGLSEQAKADGLANQRVGDILANTVSYFLLANPDGWRRGDKDLGNVQFMRYNGNGVDLNRNWPTIGNTNLRYTPWSEPEARSFGKALKAIKPKWAGGIDLHGQIIDRAFSFTLIGGGQRPYDKNERVMQFVEQAYEDASTRLSWSKIVKPNDAFEGCVDSNNTNADINPPPCDPRVYGVQYGTIWDSISYTVTGDLGAWIDSPLGLDGDGIDNEMSLSHLGNCGTGTCYIAEAEQLHVDGNKSLIYAMLNFQTQQPSSDFSFDGRAAYLVNPRRLSHEGTEAPTAPKRSIPQEPIHQVVNHVAGTSTFEFDVLGAGTAETDETAVATAQEGKGNGKGQGGGKDKGGKGPTGGIYNGGISAEVTYTNVRGTTRTAPSAYIDRLAEDGEWANVGRGWGLDAAYAPAGQQVAVNYPEPGRYRFRLQGGAGPHQVDVAIQFTREPAWPDPIQRPYDVSNMDFFTDLRPFAGSDKLEPVAVDDVLSGSVDLTAYDTVIAVDDAFLPGYQPTSTTKEQLSPTGYTDADRDAMAAKMRAFADGGGNVVLTDDSLRALEWMGLVPEESVKVKNVYAGHVGFTLDGTTPTYDDPLAANLNKPGSSEGPGRRKQTVEPVPLGYELHRDGRMPQWYVDRAAWEAAGGRTVGLEQPCVAGLGAAFNPSSACVPGKASVDATRVALGELPVGEGRVRVVGSLLPWPTTEFPHNYGLFSYGVTFNGYELVKNVLSWQRP